MNPVLVEKAQAVVELVDLPVEVASMLAALKSSSFTSETSAMTPTKTVSATSSNSTVR
jgi:hypothetical protein